MNDQGPHHHDPQPHVHEPESHASDKPGQAPDHAPQPAYEAPHVTDASADPADHTTPPSPDHSPPQSQAAPDSKPASPNDPAAESESTATPSDRQGVRIIALMNQKGGVGKTTTAVNIGAALARDGHNVLLIDLDPQAHLTLSLGINPDALEASLYDLLTNGDVSVADVVQEVEAKGHLGVIPAEVSLAGIEAELADRVITGQAQTTLKRRCGDFFEQFDYVIMDCPPSLGLLTINALSTAREVIVPMQAHFLALQGLGKLFETITMIRQSINPSITVAGVVLCMHERQTILAGEVVDDLRQFLEQGRDADVPWHSAVIYEPPVRRNIKLAESPSFGQSVFAYAPDCHGADDYAALAQSIAAQGDSSTSIVGR